MAVKIRLARGGAKKRPYYKIVVADARAPRDGNFIEKVGTYNPLLAREDKTRITLDKARIELWLSKGALPTERVAKFIASSACSRKKLNWPSMRILIQKLTRIARMCLTVLWPWSSTRLRICRMPRHRSSDLNTIAPR